MTATEMPDYDYVSAVLQKVQAPVETAEAHGLICGFICAGSQMNGKFWMEPILGLGQGDPDILQANRDLLLQLYAVSSYKLQSMEFDFRLLLPNDETALTIRAKALSDWCHGFNTGLERSGIYLDTTISSDAREAVEHIHEISELDYEFINVTETDEKAFMEVSEYVRIAVLVVYLEIAGQGSSASGRLH